MNELLTFISSHSDSEVVDDELQLSLRNCGCILVQGTMQVPGWMSSIGFEYSFAHWFLGFPKVH